MSRSWMGWALTIAALLIRMSIWKCPALVKWRFAASMRCWGDDGSRRSARMGMAVMLYVVERWVARSFARASEAGVA